LQNSEYYLEPRNVYILGNTAADKSVMTENCFEFTSSFFTQHLRLFLQKLTLENNINTV